MRADRTARPWASSMTSRRRSDANVEDDGPARTKSAQILRTPAAAGDPQGLPLRGHPHRALHRRPLRRGGGRLFSAPPRQPHQRHRPPPVRLLDQPERRGIRRRRPALPGIRHAHLPPADRRGRGLLLLPTARGDAGDPRDPLRLSAVLLRRGGRGPVRTANLHLLAGSSAALAAEAAAEAGSFNTRRIRTQPRISGRCFRRAVNAAITLEVFCWRRLVRVMPAPGSSERAQVQIRPARFSATQDSPMPTRQDAAATFERAARPSRSPAWALAFLGRLVFEGDRLAEVWSELIGRLTADPGDAGAMLDHLHPGADARRPRGRLEASGERLGPKPLLSHHPRRWPEPQDPGVHDGRRPDGQHPPRLLA